MFFGDFLLRMRDSAKLVLSRFTGVSPLPILFLAVLLITMPARADQPIVVGLDADMSSGAAISGLAIRRGMELAIQEINDSGGVLGRRLEIAIRDHRGNPARGSDNVQAFADDPNVVAVMGGLHTPVVLSELKIIHERQIVFLVPWAAGTPIIDNGFAPNFVFRVSVRDEMAGGFLVDHAIDSGNKKLALLLEKTGWGRSNERAMTLALKAHGLAPVAVEWFGWGVRNLKPSIEKLKAAGAQTILLVSNPREGGVAVKAMASLPASERLPIISHWGITGGDFFADNREFLAGIEFQFLQTFSFFDPPANGRADEFWNKYRAKYPDTRHKEDVLAPVGTAHAYDLVHLLAKAIADAGSTDRAKVRDALESQGFHAGIMKDYAPPFTPDRHDALDAESFRILSYDENGVMRPVGKSR